MTYKDLTWEDIRLIVTISDEIIESTDKKELITLGEQGYYTRVLNKLTYTMSVP